MENIMGNTGISQSYSKQGTGYSSAGIIPSTGDGIDVLIGICFFSFGYLCSQTQRINFRIIFIGDSNAIRTIQPNETAKVANNDLNGVFLDNSALSQANSSKY
jgi:hypothetical protein